MKLFLNDPNQLETFELNELIDLTYPDLIKMSEMKAEKVFQF